MSALSTRVSPLTSSKPQTARCPVVALRTNAGRSAALTAPSQLASPRNPVVGVGLVVRDGVAVRVGVSFEVEEPVTVGVEVPIAVGLSVRLAVAVALWLAVRVAVGDGVGVSTNVSVAVGDAVGAVEFSTNDRLSA